MPGNFLEVLKLTAVFLSLIVVALSGVLGAAAVTESCQAPPVEEGFEVSSETMATAAAAAAAAASSPPAKLGAAVLGATGAVGGQILKVICSRPEQWSHVYVISRREIPAEQLPAHDGVEVHQVVVGMDDPDELRAVTSKLEHVDAGFIAMGVGAASKASHETLKKVDVTLPAAFSTGAKDAGVRHMSLLTAIGANASANIQSWWAKLLGTSAGGPFYAYCKGSIENTVAGLGFESTAAFRPAALLGTPHTPKILAFIHPYLDFVLPALYKGSDINTLAAAMVFNAEKALQGGEVAGEPLAAATPTNRIVEGNSLHDLYQAIPFENGLGEV